MKNDSRNNENKEYDGSFSDIESLADDNTKHYDVNDLPQNTDFGNGEYETDKDDEEFFAAFDDEQITPPQKNAGNSDGDFEADFEESPEKFRKPSHIANKRLLIILCCVAGAAVIALLTFLGFKLFSSNTDESAMLYFSSNILCEDGTKAVAYEAISFDLYNYADELRVSKEEIKDIDIDILCEGKSILSDCAVETGEKAMQADIPASCNVLINLPEKYANKDIEVIASTKPIKKEIKATFSYITNWGSTIEDKEGNSVAVLNLTANSDVVLEVEWQPTQVVPESTNQHIKSLSANQNKCTVKLKTGEETQIAFFKTDIKKDYSKKNDAIKVKVVESK